MPYEDRKRTQNGPRKHLSGGGRRVGRRPAGRIKEGTILKFVVQASKKQTREAIMTHLGPYCGQLGPILWPIWGYLGPCWGHLVPSLNHVEPIPGTAGRGRTNREAEQQMTDQCSKMCTAPRREHHFVASWAILGNLGAILGHLGTILGPSWEHLGPSWGHLGRTSAIMNHLGPSWGFLGPSWGLLGPS